MQFAYKAREISGKTMEGTVEAADQRAGIEKLRSQKLIVLQIAETKATGGKGGGFFKPKVKSGDIVIFSRQFSTLVASGVPIVQGLSILEAQAENPAFKTVLTALRADIEGGLAIADAMKKHPDAFNELYVSMIRAGEVGGILDTILERLSAYLESSEALKAKVKAAMMYPVIITIIAGGITIFLLVGVIPTFKTIFADFGAELPMPTQILMGISDILKHNFLYLVGAGIGAFFGFKKFAKSKFGRKKLDNLILKLPVFGILLKKVAIAKFSRTLGTLIKSGVPILQGLETVATTAGNVVVEEAINSCRDSIREGGRIADPLKKANLFPPMVVSMVGVGEETGCLDNMLVRIADFYDQEVDTAVKGLTSMIEPIVIVVMGVVIGGIVIAMFMPMLSMSDMVDN